MTAKSMKGNTMKPLIENILLQNWHFQFTATNINVYNDSPILMFIHLKTINPFSCVVFSVLKEETESVILKKITTI